MPAPALSPRPPRRVRWPVPVVLAVLMHLTMIVLLWTAWRATNDSQPTLGPMIVRWLTAPVVRQEEAAPVQAKPAQPRVMPRPGPSTQVTPGSLPSINAAPADAPAPAGEPTPDPAAEPSAKPLNIDSDTISRAARDVVRNPSLTRRSDEIVGKTEPPTKQEVLAARVAQSAKKDCLKGDYEGKNDGNYKPRLGGLFDIPLIVADAITGKCRN